MERIAHPGWCENLVAAGGLRQDERVLVVVDEPLLEEGSQLAAAVKDAGYKGATTVDEGLATPDEPFKLKRIRINGDDGVEGFASKMQSAE